MFTYFFSKVLGTPGRRAWTIATSCFPLSYFFTFPPPPPSPLGRVSINSTEHSKSVNNTPCPTPTKVENANYTDTFDSRIITTISVASSKQERPTKRERKRKKVHFDLSANTLHKYDWSTLGHENFPERQTDMEKYICMSQYREAIIQRFPELTHGGWKCRVGSFEYAYLVYEEEREKVMRQRRVEALAETLMWGTAMTLVTCSALLFWCFAF